MYLPVNDSYLAQLMQAADLQSPNFEERGVNIYAIENTVFRWSCSFEDGLGFYFVLLSSIRLLMLFDIFQ